MAYIDDNGEVQFNIGQEGVQALLARKVAESGDMDFIRETHVNAYEAAVKNGRLDILKIVWGPVSIDGVKRLACMDNAGGMSYDEVKSFIAGLFKGSAANYNVGLRISAMKVFRKTRVISCNGIEASWIEFGTVGGQYDVFGRKVNKIAKTSVPTVIREGGTIVIFMEDLNGDKETWTKFSKRGNIAKYINTYFWTLPQADVSIQYLESGTKARKDTGAGLRERIYGAKNHCFAQSTHTNTEIFNQQINLAHGIKVNIIIMERAFSNEEIKGSATIKYYSLKDSRLGIIHASSEANLKAGLIEYQSITNDGKKMKPILGIAGLGNLWDRSIVSIDITKAKLPEGWAPKTSEIRSADKFTIEGVHGIMELLKEKRPTELKSIASNADAVTEGKQAANMSKDSREVFNTIAEALKESHYGPKQRWYPDDKGEGTINDKTEFGNSGSPKVPCSDCTDDQKCPKHMPVPKVSCPDCTEDVKCAKHKVRPPQTKEAGPNSPDGDQKARRSKGLNAPSIDKMQIKRLAAEPFAVRAGVDHADTVIASWDPDTLHGSYMDAVLVWNEDHPAVRAIVELNLDREYSDVSIWTTLTSMIQDAIRLTAIDMWYRVGDENWADEVKGAIQAHVLHYACLTALQGVTTTISRNSKRGKGK